MKIRLSLLLLALVLTAAAVPEAFGAKAIGGGMKAGSRVASHATKGRGDVLACDAYWIQCNDGTQDGCCADFNSCFSYCESFCGGPCVYQGEAAPVGVQ